MHKLLHFVFYMSFATLCGCKTSQIKSSLKTVYTQDLSQYRTHYEVKPLDFEALNTTSSTNNRPKQTSVIISPETDNINAKLNKLSEAYKKLDKALGYRIQFYSGKSFEDAKRKQVEARTKLPEDVKSHIFIEYKQPYYKVKMGNYLHKTEVYHILKQIQHKFSDAQAITDEISLEKLRNSYLNSNDDKD